MSAPTDLTGRISHLRERKEASPVIGGRAAPPKRPRKPHSERRQAPDFFMIFAYTLLGIALAGQLLLIVALELR